MNMVGSSHYAYSGRSGLNVSASSSSSSFRCCSNKRQEAPFLHLQQQCQPEPYPRSGARGTFSGTSGKTKSSRRSSTPNSSFPKVRSWNTASFTGLEVELLEDALLARTNSTTSDDDSSSSGNSSSSSSHLEDDEESFLSSSSLEEMEGSDYESSSAGVGLRLDMDYSDNDQQQSEQSSLYRHNQGLESFVIAVGSLLKHHQRQQQQQQRQDQSHGSSSHWSSCSGSSHYRSYPYNDKNDPLFLGGDFEGRRDSPSVDTGLSSSLPREVVVHLDVAPYAQLYFKQHQQQQQPPQQFQCFNNKHHGQHRHRLVPPPQSPYNQPNVHDEEQKQPEPQDYSLPQEKQQLPSPPPLPPPTRPVEIQLGVKMVQQIHQRTSPPSRSHSQDPTSPPPISSTSSSSSSCSSSSSSSDESGWSTGKDDDSSNDDDEDGGGSRGLLDAFLWVDHDWYYQTTTDDDDDMPLLQEKQEAYTKEMLPPSSSRGRVTSASMATNTKKTYPPIAAGTGAHAVQSRCGLWSCYRQKRNVHPPHPTTTEEAFSTTSASRPGMPSLLFREMATLRKEQRKKTRTTAVEPTVPKWSYRYETLQEL